MDGLAAVDFFNHLNMLYGTVTEFCGREEVTVLSVCRVKRGDLSLS